MAYVYTPECAFSRGQRLRVIYPQIAHEGIVYSTKWNGTKWVIKIVHNSKSGGGVCVVDLEEFEADAKGPAQVTANPASPEHEAQIILNADWALANQVGYLALFQNCEHFCEWCYSGQVESHSVNSLKEFVVVGATMVAGIALVKGIAESFRGR